MDEESRRELIEETQEEVIENLEKLYEDDEIVVLAAPDDSELEKLILNILKEKRMKFKELKEAFSATAGEDRLRRAILKLMEEHRIKELPDGSYTASAVDEVEGFGEYTTSSDLDEMEDILSLEEGAEEELESFEGEEEY